jgi:DNA mismatch endonuclease, patch repair protein
MADVVDRVTRSRMMSGIRGKNTTPELVLRRRLHARGLRFRLHPSTLPGRPDLVFPQYRAAVFVNGCFWHMHECHLFKWPGTRPFFWEQKLTHNCLRDVVAVHELLDMGWRVAIVWECALRKDQAANMTAERIEKWLYSRSKTLNVV